MIDYISKYQASFVSYFLFNKNLTNIIEKGVSIEPLLTCPIFCYEFTYDEWPSVSTNSTHLSVPYNASIFELRHQYKNCYQKISQEEEQGNQDKKHIDFSKVYKIKYTVNLLPSIGMYVENDLATEKLRYHG